MNILEKIDKRLKNDEMKPFMEDPLYKAVLTAKNEKDFKKKLDTLLSIRGSNALKSLQNAMKKAKIAEDIVDNLGINRVMQLMEQDEEYYDGVVDTMLDFIMSLDTESLSEEQLDMIEDILDELDPDENEEIPEITDEDELEDELDDVDEAFKKRVRRDLAKKRQRRRAYKRKRATVRIKARKYRRSAIGKRTARKAKRYKKIGRTSTMKRQRKFVGANI